MTASGLEPGTARLAGYRLERVESLPSTSDACVERARAGEPDGLAILADGQTAARGSRGRSWAVQPGNLYLSVLLRPRNRAEEAGAGQWALLAGVALIEALARFAAEPAALRLKWPNDVLSDGAKLAGILVDAAMTAGGMHEGGGADWLVIGVGANLASAPVIEGRRIAALVTPDGAPPSPVSVARSFWRASRRGGGCWRVRASQPSARLGSAGRIRLARRSRSRMRCASARVFSRVSRPRVNCYCPSATHVMRSQPGTCCWVRGASENHAARHRCGKYQYRHGGA